MDEGSFREGLRSGFWWWAEYAGIGILSSSQGSEMAGGSDGSGGEEGSEMAGGDGSGGGEGSEMAGGDGGGEGPEEATDLQMALFFR